MQEDTASQPESPPLAEGGNDATLKNTVEALKGLVLALLHQVESLSESPPLRESSGLDFSEEVQRFEAELIRNALIRTGGRQRQAARLLNMKPTTLHSRIKRYRLNANELVKTAAAQRRQADGRGPCLLDTRARRDEPSPAPGISPSD